MPAHRSNLVTFKQLQRRLGPELLPIALNEQAKYLAFLSVDEILAWLWEELWNAITHFDRKRAPKGDYLDALKGFWWECWKNRRRKLITHTYTHSYRFNQNAIHLNPLARGWGMQEDDPFETLVEDALGVEEQVIPTCPVRGLLEWRVWRMLAVSTIRTEQDRAELYLDICRELDIPAQLLVEILESFNNSFVHDHLTGGM